MIDFKIAASDRYCPCVPHRTNATETYIGIRPTYVIHFLRYHATVDDDDWTTEINWHFENFRLLARSQKRMIDLIRDVCS